MALSALFGAVAFMIGTSIGLAVLLAPHFLPKGERGMSGIKPAKNAMSVSKPLCAKKKLLLNKRWRKGQSHRTCGPSQRFIRKETKGSYRGWEQARKAKAATKLKAENDYGPAL